MTLPAALRFSRSRSNRVLLGVAGGLSERIGVDSLFIRAAFVLLAVNGLLGVWMYLLLLWLAATTRQLNPMRPITDRHNLGFFCLLLSMLFASRFIGYWIGDDVMWPATFVGVGSTVILLRSEKDTQRWETNRLSTIFGSRPSRLRLAFGTIAVAVGISAFLATNHATTDAGRTLLAVLATAAGMALIFGPWLTRLGRQVIDERNLGIRSAERAEMGAHLHDSVLQTLAMIQRAESPERMVALARQQERELRSWLHGRAPDEETSVKGALEAFAHQIDTDHSVATNVVVVGDRPMTEELRPIVSAVREAILNAARHSGAPAVHVYVEISDEKATALVRDEGIGFDAAAVGTDRQGIRESITGRMNRHGGTATITTSMDNGTEIELVLPLEKREW
jgi:signal transduction histidine kinase